MKTRGFEVVSGFEDRVVALPKRQTAGSAGYDFYAIEDVEIQPNELVFVKTGLKAYMPKDEVLEIYIRSSMATQRGLILINAVGIIDSDYYNNPQNEGHILIPLYNLSKEVQRIKKGERIAQGIFKKYLKVDGDVESGVRQGGFGSSND
ncbi:MAG TPA: dUTP diphosphatase [Haloplasmataceae bacterium]